MDAKLNQGDFVKLENTLADAVKDGADVKLKVEPVYEAIPQDLLSSVLLIASTASLSPSML